jgi:hypothetical protein
LTMGFAANAALAQEINPLVRERIVIGQPQPTQLDRRQVRVQVGVNFFLAGPVDDGEEATKLRDRARRSIYEMAGRECDLLEDTVARECRLESITVNVNRQGQVGQMAGFNVNGQLGFQVTVK